MKLDLVIDAIKWGLAVGLVFLFGVISVYGGVHVVLGVFEGVVQSLVLGFMLLVSGSIALYLLRTLTLHWIDMQD